MARQDERGLAMQHVLYHLALLSSLLYFSNDFLFLILQCHALSVKLSDGLVQHTLVLP